MVELNIFFSQYDMNQLSFQDHYARTIIVIPILLLNHKTIPQIIKLSNKRPSSRLALIYRYSLLRLVAWPLTLQSPTWRDRVVCVLGATCLGTACWGLRCLPDALSGHTRRLVNILYITRLYHPPGVQERKIEDRRLKIK